MSHLRIRPGNLKLHLENRTVHIQRIKDNLIIILTILFPAFSLVNSHLHFDSQKHTDKKYLFLQVGRFPPFSITFSNIMSHLRLP